MNRIAIFIMIVALFPSFVGCSGAQRRVIGSSIGGEVGAFVGRTGGGAKGSSIGSYMDKQAEELQADLESAKIERVGEGIKITFDSDNLFVANEATLRLEDKTNLARMAVVLNKYIDTNILVEGHTDATGSDELNMEISTNQAASVANHLAALGVDASRLMVKGYGESQPIVTNDTDSGRKENRRVEIVIMANDKLKKAAK